MDKIRTWIKRAKLLAARFLRREKRQNILLFSDYDAWGVLVIAKTKETIPFATISSAIHYCRDKKIDALMIKDIEI